MKDSAENGGQIIEEQHVGSELITIRTVRKILGKQELSIDRILISVSGLLVIFLGLQIWGFSVGVPASNLFSLSVIAAGLSICILPFIFHSRNWRTYLEILTLVFFAISIVSLVHSLVYTSPSYGTDEISFDQYAAQLFLKGKNPYLFNLAPSLNLFQVPSIYHTYTMTGGTVDIQSYPALSFLAYVPFMAMGFLSQVAVYVDVAFWILTILLLYILLPRPYKMISVILGSAPLYDGYVVGGVVDCVFMPFLLFAAWKWDKYGQNGEGWASWIGPIALGFAVSVKQTPWFVAPFLAVAIFMEYRSWKLLGRYVGTSVITFLVINGYFLLRNPVAFLKGIFAPFDSSTIPSGQGLINLTLVERLGGGNLSLYTVGAILLLLTFLLLEVFYYKHFKRLIFLLPSVVLFFPSRSFGSYLIDLFPIFLLSLLTVQSVAHEKKKLSNKKRIAFGVSFVPVLLVFAIAVAVPPPLKMKILKVHTTGQIGTIESMTVNVKNTTNKLLKPHFTITMSPELTTFWIVNKGPMTLAPYQSADYSLAAPNVQSMPSITGGFLVDAFTIKPSALSTTPIYEPQSMHTYILPQSVDYVVPLHKPVQIQVELLDHIGRRIHQAGVPVYLGQVVYDQEGLLAGESSINGSPEGKSPVMALTDTNGIATFYIVGVQPQDNPIYYQSFIEAVNHFPYGYSEMISIRYS